MRRNFRACRAKQNLFHCRKVKVAMVHLRRHSTLSTRLSGPLRGQLMRTAVAAEERERRLRDRERRSRPVNAVPCAI